jgi:Fe-S cluster assembly protein SufD
MSFPLEMIPTTKSERWKYTNLPRLLKKMNLSAATLGWSDNVSLLNPNAPGAAQYGDTQLWDLNSENVKDVKFLNADAEISVDAKDGQWLSPRLIIQANDGQDITIIERQTGKGSYWKNNVAQVVVGKNVRVRHYRFVTEAEGGVNTLFTHVTLARDAVYETFNMIEGAGLVRNQIHAEIQGENAHCILNGVNLLSGSQHIDTTITIEHQAPHCQSNQNYKTVLAGQSRGVFQGKVHVHQIAQKTDGYQRSDALILSPLAEMDTKPELEIYADDVKCSHGATTGQLDEGPLFYLRSRGIPEKEARVLLIESFCGGTVDEITDETIRAQISEQVSQWLATQI